MRGTFYPSSLLGEYMLDLLTNALFLWAAALAVANLWMLRHLAEHRNTLDTLYRTRERLLDHRDKKMAERVALLDERDRFLEAHQNRLLHLIAQLEEKK